MTIWLGHFLALLEFLFCEHLAAPVILGTDCCDWLVEAIHPRTKSLELDDGTTVPNGRRPLKSAANIPKLSPSWEPKEGGGR